MEDLQLNLNNQENIQNVKPMNFIQRVTGIIVSPEKTMNDLAEKPRILFPFIGVSLGILVFYLVRFPLYVEFLRNAAEMAAAQRGQQLTPEQMEASMKIASIIGLVGAPIGALFGWLVLTAALFGLAKILKGKGTFKQYMSVTGYAFVITLLSYLVNIIASFFTGELMLNTSLGLLVPDMKGMYVYGVLRGIDFFSLWYYAIIGIGIVVVSKLSRAKVYTVMGIVYLAMVLLSAISLKNM